VTQAVGDHFQQLVALLVYGVEVVDVSWHLFRSAAEKGPGSACATTNDIQNGVHGFAAAVAHGKFLSESFCRFFNDLGQPFQFGENCPWRDA